MYFLKEVMLKKKKFELNRRFLFKVQTFLIPSSSSSSSSFFFFFLKKKLCVDCENITIELHILIISSILAKFQEDQKLIDMS